MIIGIDHVVVAVGSVDDAVDEYVRMGFSCEAGGRHPGKGTRNALVGFDENYLEFLEVTDVQEAMSAGPSRAALVDHLQRSGGGLASLALESDSLVDDIARLRSAGLSVRDPMTSQRVRPDGSVVGWKTAGLGDTAVREPWPFLIAWTPGPKPVSQGRSAQHPNGAVGVRAVALAVHDLAVTTSAYEILASSPAGPERSVDELDAVWRSVRVGTGAVDLLAPRHQGRGALWDILAAHGPGPFQCRIEVADMARFERSLRAAGLELRPSWPSAMRIRDARVTSAGVAFVVQEAPAW